MWKFSVIIAVILWLGLEQATACDCPRFSEAEQIAQADAIVVVDMTKFAATTSLMQSSCPDPIGTAEVTVLETFKGANVPKNLSVELSAYSGEEVHIGKYLMFLHRDKSGGRWTGGIGSGECQTFGMPLFTDEGTRMLSYVRDRPSKGKGGRVIGKVHSTDSSLPFSDIRIELLNEAGILIKSTKPNASFEYVFDRVPVGTYSIQVGVPDTYGLSSTSNRVRISDQEIVSKDVVLTYTGKISGVLVDGEGIAYAESEIFIVENENTINPIEGYTDKNGYFEFLRLPPGSYRLALARRQHHNRIDKPFSQWVPYYYPGTDSYAHAFVVKLDKNQQQSGMRFSLPKSLVSVQLRGRLTDKFPIGELGITSVGLACATLQVDGKPGFHNQAYNTPVMPIQSDGRFSFQILTGQKYVIFANGIQHSDSSPSSIEYESIPVVVDANTKQPVELPMKRKKNLVTTQDYERDSDEHHSRMEKLCGSEW